MNRLYTINYKADQILYGDHFNLYERNSELHILFVVYKIKFFYTHSSVHIR